jgi:hypothetical protein
LTGSLVSTNVAALNSSPKATTKKKEDQAKSPLPASTALPSTASYPATEEASLELLVLTVSQLHKYIVQ